MNNTKRGLLLALCIGFAPVLCAQDATSVQTDTSKMEAAKPCDDCIPGLSNFAKISEALWRGNQPTAEGFKNLEKAGVKTIINFRQDHDDLPLLKGTQLKYIRIPSKAYFPRQKNLVTFLKVMENPANWPVFIHCAQGRDRTGYNVAAYRMVFQGWGAENAIKEMKNFHFNKVWVLNPGFLRKLNVENLRRMIKDLPEPVFQ